MKASQKLHIDTDLGGDIDDLCALAMVLAWPDVELVGVTTVAEHGGKRAGYARYTLELAGQPDIPVAAGADASLGCYRSWPSLPNEADYWPEPVPASPTPLDEALSLLEHSIEAGAIVVGIGPFTNLALLERRTPGILEQANLVLMGSFVFPPREGYPTVTNEMDYNVQVDVESARVVLERSFPTLVPLSITVETYLRRAHLAQIGKSGALGELIAAQSEAFAKDESTPPHKRAAWPALPGDTINFQHDPLACAIALDWYRGVAMEEVPLRFEIEDGYLREIVDPAGRLTTVVTRVDGDAFSNFWVRVVSGAMTRDDKWL
ncbi:MAG TPA: nucleoside hydrolase [Rhodothermia bacterium]|nr:nucleoside hydrolase [Rhodothermia bacterium]